MPANFLVEKTSIIVSTYNSPRLLERVLWGYSSQTTSGFQVVIADDGSTGETSALIQQMRCSVPFELVHVWQPDDGFQKCRILNKAVAAASGDYLIFTDGDCIPRNDFVAQHISNSEEGFFLSGAYLKLPPKVSDAIEKTHIETQEAFCPAWLHGQGFRLGLARPKLNRSNILANLLNKIPIKPTWNGNNSSCSKRALLSVNGFDESMQYGGEDCEFGYRLINSGVRARRIRYSTIAIHLHHSRGYVTQQMISNNLKTIKKTRENNSTWTYHGIDKYL